ncbi:hypothetical protein [Streptomyces tsukubensis]|uniref:Lipoprotein n=1 Tax=Streptomyces tsukubensis (strain DSM 42081 / NBRC 108919 / NRRL 18488 / 9993) TaxID=1114943 RepID=A0A7G3UEJ2_STRT9|nr:hypothetical protein [Streptomyces tsukubensis]QKM67520.1 hypothetical protein STSU_010435 [Streptomyces tsukubensis NRRL18488]TAI43914.1 hypothetical protein EWI31_10240 [Streptomyces tsukubensis]
MRPRARRPLTVPALLAGAVAVLAGLLSGCGTAGDLRSAGPTPTATGPVRLWPDLPPVTAPPYDYGEIDTVAIPGVQVPSGGVRALDPVAVVRAEARTYPMSYYHPKGPPEPLTDRLAACASRGGKGAAGTARKPGECPVLTPYYRDLTGDRREELIVGVRLGRQLTEVRVFTPGAQKDPRVLTRIMATSDQLVSVELAGRDIILRSVSAGIPGYEYRTAWSWDEQHQAMLPTRDEIVRVKPRSDKPAPAAGTGTGAGLGGGGGTGAGRP